MVADPLTWWGVGFTICVIGIIVGTYLYSVVYFLGAYYAGETPPDADYGTYTMGRAVLWCLIVLVVPTVLGYVALNGPAP